MIQKIKNIVLKAKSYLPRLKRSWTCYHHIRQIKLSDFIIAHCDKDYSVLIIKGNPTQEELEQVWKGLYEDYVKAIGGVELSGKISSIKTYILLESKIKQASMLLELFQVEQAHDMIARKINKFGYGIGNVTKENLPKMIKIFESKVKTDIVRLNALAREIEKGTDKKDQEITEASYYDMIAAIAETLKIVINPNETNVLQYVSLVNQYKKHINNLIKQNK